jgi:hypothetical protein
MAFEGDHERRGVPMLHRVMHYHGDETRMIFFASAIVLIIAQSTGASLPLTTTGAVFAAVLLVVAAGITNPAQSSIHWFNAFIAICGTLLFGLNAVNHYRAGISLFDPSFAYTETLALLSLVALYFTTRTIRGDIQRPDLE